MYKQLLARRQELNDSRTEGEGGFTLIELLVVVVIIGILVAIAIPLYLHFENGAKTSSAETDTHNLVNAIQQCASDAGGNIPTAVALKAGSTTDVVLTSASTSSPAVACDDASLTSGNTVTYAVGTTANTYTLKVINGTSNKGAEYDSATGQTTQIQAAA